VVRKAARLIMNFKTLTPIKNKIKMKKIIIIINKKEAVYTQGYSSLVYVMAYRSQDSETVICAL